MNQLESHTQLVIIVDTARGASLYDHHSCLTGYQYDLLRSKLLRSGFEPQSVLIKPLSLLESGETLPERSVIVGLGESSLKFFTDRRSVDKWVLSPLRDREGRLYIPSYGFDRIQKQFELNLYLEKALLRAKELTSRTSPFTTPEERFLLNPSLEETLHVLDRIAREPEVAVDVETGYGQINTVGFAWSPSDAIAINVLPGNFLDGDYFRLWTAISAVLKSPSRKIFQNFIYDTSYFSAYGVRTRGEIFDTMWAMKFLWPEFKSNLGNVGRFYTIRPYWKDDGKVTDEEGQKKNWGNVRDWTKHYIYNCRDTTGTLEASHAQRADLASRDLLHLFESYVGRLIEPIREMCANGMPLSLDRRTALKRETEARLEGFTKSFSEKTKGVNPRSPRQVMGWLRAEGVALPKKYDKATGNYKESTDSASIKKIRLKRDLPGLSDLQEIKSLDKALSSYINFDIRPDGRLSYSLNGAGTESLRWSGNKDPWDRGFNIQTIPREGGDVSIKSMFVAPEGDSFVEIDLRQAESRFVAYDSADKTLIDMLESGADVHTHVGNAILRQMGRDPSQISKEEFKATWRQLGKKAGHGLNYGMKAGVFVETVFNELDLVITRKDAELISQAYFGLFPGIKRWHGWIRSELYNKRKLTAPSGWQRYFYGRPDDALKEALSWRPQHSIPWIMNHLMLHLCDERKRGNLKFRLIYQCHDSLCLLAPEGEVERISSASHVLDNWHPMVELPGGRMRIPIEVKAGSCMADLSEVTHG